MVHTTALISSDNLSSYPPANQHSSNNAYRIEVEGPCQTTVGFPTRKWTWLKSVNISCYK